ncbi:MAG TPA: hypothetical protein VGO87_15185, partial [Acidimicrobiia bacterium]
MRLRNKLAIAAVGTVAAISVSTAAFAYWSTSGSGSGSATVGTDTNVSIDSTAFDATLYPGSSVGVTFTITNHMANTSASVGQVVADTGVSNAWPNGISGVSGNCLPADFSFSSSALGYLVPAGGSLPGSGTLALSNSSANQDDCKNAHP